MEFFARLGLFGTIQINFLNAFYVVQLHDIE